MRRILLFVAASLVCGFAVAQQKSTPAIQKAEQKASDSPPAQRALTPPVERSEQKSLESATALVQSLIQLALVLTGGTVIILLSTSYHRPKHKWVRRSYLTFIVGWLFLGLSVNSGVQVQGAYTSFLIRNHADLDETKRTMTNDAANQKRFLEWALIVFAAWLLVYLFWWIFNEEATETEKKEEGEKELATGSATAPLTETIQTVEAKSGPNEAG